MTMPQHLRLSFINQLGHEGTNKGSAFGSGGSSLTFSARSDRASEGSARFGLKVGGPGRPNADPLDKLSRPYF